MAAITIRKLSEETHRALKLRAARNNRSTEAEVRAILEAAVLPQSRLKIGTAIFEISRACGVTTKDVEAMEEARDRAPAEPMRFE